MNEYKKYRQKTIVEARDYVTGESLDGIFIPEGIELDKGKIVRGIDGLEWYFREDAFNALYEEIK